MKQLSLLAPSLALATVYTLAIPGSVIASEDTASDAEAPVVMEETRVIGVRQRLYQTGVLKDVIQKTEVIDEQLLEARQAVNLSQAVAASPGVRVSNECSMCGVKRIMLNGMRGEHTTILTDGIPLHTMIAGYYAVDAIATTGVSQIEVARGAGASLIAPEAVGGTINVVSIQPDENSLEFDLALEEDDGYFASALGTLVSPDGRHRASFVTQLDTHQQVDADNNGVSEAPLQENRNFNARLSSDLSDRDNVTVRAAYIDSEIFGGPTNRGSINAVLRDYDGIESAELFENGDVRRRYIGKPWETTEWIDSERKELSATWLREFNGDYNASLTFAYSEHEQDSFYEGFDYRAQDELTYLDFRNNLRLGDNHLLTFGIDQRDEKMRSQSDAGVASDRYIEDSFDYLVTGLYLQETWSVSDAFEIALALRVDTVEADFVAPQKPGTEIDETVFAPRLDARYQHNDSWASRLSAGRGYRAPLSFFETDHGILDAGDGFAIDVDDLEESLSLNYALSFEGEKLTSTISLAYTEVDNLASMDETGDGVPLLTQMEETATVNAVDLALGYRVNDSLTLSASAEHFDYDTQFSESYAIAPIEQRLVFNVDYSVGQWQAFATAIWVGERNLARYGYEGFDVFDSVAKSTKAEDYWTVDMRISRDFGGRYTAYVGAYNLFDTTQAGDMQSPLFFDADGGYDVAYIYGPLRGREFYAGIQVRM